MPDLDDYAHLWDGSEPGWRLHVTNHLMWRIRIVFSDSRPTTRELRAMRRLLPELRAQPVREVMASLGCASSYDLPAAVGNIEMYDLMRRAEALGLNAKATVEDHSWGVPVRDGCALVIEDEQLARRVWEQMEAAGVPVHFTEVD